MLGFTRRETSVLLFLAGSFFIGIVAWTYQNRWAPLPELSEEGVVQTMVSQESMGEQKEVVASPKSVEEKISLNKAKREDFERLRGVGPVTAARIVEYRERNGNFRSIEEIMEVKGIGSKTMERLKPYLKLN